VEEDVVAIDVEVIIPHSPGFLEACGIPIVDFHLVDD
jgi:hypothetical protein